MEQRDLPTRPQLDEQVILSLCRMRDPYGVLSVYVGARPEEQSTQQPAWAVEIKNQFSELRSTVKDEGPRERWVAFTKRLEDLTDDLDALLDPRGHGRGRALFVPVEGGQVVHIALQVPFSNRVVLDEGAYVRPLVATLDEGRPTGVVAVERPGVRVLGWRLGEADELVYHTFDEATGDWREHKGPTAANPAMAQQTASHRERFDKRLEDNRDRFHRSVAGRISKMVRERGWERLVVLRGGRMTELERALTLPNGVQLVAMDAHLGGSAPHEVAEKVTEIVRDAHRQDELELVELAKDRAASGGAGVVGLADTLTTLGEGRVNHLLFDDRAELEGLRASDGRLFAAGSDVSGTDLVREPRLVERMVERALDTGARVTPVDGSAATAIESCGGAAALLRW